MHLHSLYEPHPPLFISEGGGGGGCPRGGQEHGQVRVVSWTRAMHDLGYILLYTEMPAI